MDNVLSFSGQYRFLSNFYLCQIEVDGDIYRSVEHAYQASKTLDPIAREIVRVCRTPAQAKAMGRQVPIRPDWSEIKLHVMLSLLRQKFSRSYLKAKLLATDDALLVEGNTWGDTYWGVHGGAGLNHLGKLLMLLRTELRNAG